jgi:hypothetical protein
LKILSLAKIIFSRSGSATIISLPLIDTQNSENRIN